MTTENKIISTICSSREAFLKLIPVVDPNTFTDFGKSVFKEIQTYYNTDNTAQSVDLDLVKKKIIEENPKKTPLIEDYFASLPEASSADNILRLYQEQAKAKLREELIIALGSNHEKKVLDLIDQYLTINIEETPDELFNGVPIEELAIQFNKENLVPIYPTALNQAIGGGVPRQTQLCIFARPDVGKTTVAINVAVGAAESGYKVLYVGNEDPASKMVVRMLTRFTRKPEKDVLSGGMALYKEAVERGYKNLFFVSMHPGTYGELRKYIEKIRPDLVVIDQIRNMNFKPESMTINLEQGVIATRNLAKEFNFVSVVVTQAGNSAVNKVVLNMEDVEWSNTGVAAQMDLMVGVGQNDPMKDARVVTLSFPKNKLTPPLKPITANIEYELNRLTVSQ